MNSPKKARYIMIGGFLGAGKTTCISRLAQKLTNEGLRVGLITNDQGSELVDTTMLRARGFPTEEIPGGCFCCRFNSLTVAAKKLTAASQPDVFIAEPVGSCTDLVATVTYPLRRMYGEQFSISPLSVLVDPIRAQRIFGLSSGGRFSDKVIYIYRKQLEEADLIVINKQDLLTPEQITRLGGALRAEFPKADTLWVSARNGHGLDEWFKRIAEQQQPPGQAMRVDYEVYAAGEALLGWLNSTVALDSTIAFDANSLLELLAQRIQDSLNTSGAQIAHLKMTLSPNEGLGEIAVVSVVRNDFVPELSSRIEHRITGGQMIINCRAEAPSTLLLSATQSALSEVFTHFEGLKFHIEHSEHFQPGKPQPTYRLAHSLE